MKRKLGPSELATCSRCGLTRQVNAGRKRKAMGTGLCFDCYHAQEWQCPACLQVFSENYKSLHKQACPS